MFFLQREVILRDLQVYPYVISGSGIACSQRCCWVISEPVLLKQQLNYNVNGAKLPGEDIIFALVEKFLNILPSKNSNLSC
jgi:hypothetical protein